MCAVKMKVITGKVIGGKLPIGLDIPDLRGTDNFGATVRSTEKQVQVKAHFSKIVGEWWNLGAPAAKDQTLVAIKAGMGMSPSSSFRRLESWYKSLANTARSAPVRE